MNTDDFKRRFDAGERDFSFEDLQKVDLNWRDLSHVSFKGSNLKHANLSFTNLTEANLQEANLTFANLNGSNLTQANIQGAVLEGANLNQVKWTAVLYDPSTQFPHGVTAESIEAECQQSRKTPAAPDPLSTSETQIELQKSQARQKLEEAKRMNAEAEALRQKAEQAKKQAEADLQVTQGKVSKLQQAKQKLSQARDKIPFSVEGLPSQKPKELLKQTQDLNPVDLVKQVQGAVNQATQALASSAQNFLQSSPPTTIGRSRADSKSDAEDEDTLIAEIIDDEDLSSSSTLTFYTEPSSVIRSQSSNWQVCTSLKSTGHLSLVLSPDHTLLAVGQSSSNLGIWKIGPNACQHWYSFLGQQNGIYGIAFSPDQSLIASGAGDGKITIWQLKSKALLRTLTPSSYQAKEAASNQTLFQTHNPGQFIHSYKAAVSAIAFSPEGDRLIAGYANGTLRLWDVNKGTSLKEKKLHRGPITQVKYSANGKLIITSSMDQSMQVILSNLWKSCHTHQFDESWPCDCAITPDHQFAIAGLHNGQIHAWNLTQDRMQYHMRAAHQPGLMNLHLSTNSTLISVSQDQHIKQWNWQTGKLLGTQTGSYPSSLSLDHTMLAFTNPQNKIHVLRKIP